MLSRFFLKRPVFAWVIAIILMVASGLVNNPRVSHYRLAAHLLLAFFTFAATLWTALDLRAGRFDDSGHRGPPIPGARAWTTAFLVLLTLQVTWGAFVAGLRAGFMFNTFPGMGGHFVPPALAAVITGHLAQKRQPYARGFWMTGLITGYIGLALCVLVLIFFIVIIAAFGTSYSRY